MSAMYRTWQLGNTKKKFLTTGVAEHPSSGVHTRINISYSTKTPTTNTSPHDDIFVAVYHYTENNTFLVKLSTWTPKHDILWTPVVLKPQHLKYINTTEHAIGKPTHAHL